MKNAAKILNHLKPTFNKRFSRHFLCSTKIFSSNDKNNKNKVIKDFNQIIQPLSVKPYNDPDGINVGDELAGKISKGGFISIIHLKKN